MDGSIAPQCYYQTGNRQNIKAQPFEKQKCINIWSQRGKQFYQYIQENKHIIPILHL
jgi:hypothetical protein